MAIRRTYRKIERTPEELAELKAVREQFQRDRPGPEVLMPCDHAGCGEESTHSIGVWLTPNHMQVHYYCEEHAPDGSTPVDDDETGA